MKSSPAPPCGHRPEGVVERLGHRRVAVAGVLGVHVEVARVPARLAAGGARVVAGRLVGLVGERGVVGELDLHAPADLAVGVALGLRDHRRHAQLGRPLAGRIGPGRNARVVLPGGSMRGLRDVLRLGREALGRERHVAVARAAPAAELARAPDARAPAARLVQAEVERVAAAARLRRGPSSTSRGSRSCRAGPRTAPSRSSC